MGLVEDHTTLCTLNYKRGSQCIDFGQRENHTEAFCITPLLSPLGQEWSRALVLWGFYRQM
jgi:hypothetical protein